MFVIRHFFQIIIAQIEHLDFLAALSFDELFPVIQQYITFNFLVASHVQHLQFGQFEEHVHWKRGQFLAVIDFHVCQHGEVVPVPVIFFFFVCFAVSRFRVIYQFHAEIICHDRRVGNEEVFQLGAAHQGFRDTFDVVGQVTELYVLLVNAVTFLDRFEVRVGIDTVNQNL